MQASSFLQDLSASDFDTLCQHAQQREYLENDIIFKEGDSALEFYFVKSGKIAIYIQKYHRTEDISTIYSGDCFGEMAILNNSRRTASAKALQATTLLCLDKKTFHKVIQKHPQIGLKFRR